MIHHSPAENLHGHNKQLMEHHLFMSLRLVGNTEQIKNVWLQAIIEAGSVIWCILKSFDQKCVLNQGHYLRH